MAFVHGDNQYGYERALALLKQEKFIESFGVGNMLRFRAEIPLIHIGDNGDYYRGTEERDQEAWEILAKFYDEMLIGNHEAAVMFEMPLSGYAEPNKVVSETMWTLWDERKLKFATSYDGFLITHAGVHPSFEALLPEDPVEAAQFLNELDSSHPIINQIGRYRGGYDLCGGILWRDMSENISDKWPQIFGHSRLINATRFGKHYGIDVGYPGNGRIAGIYTDSKKVVEVNIND